MTDSAVRVRTERDGGVQVVVLARPERRNALDDAMVDGLRAAILAAEADPAVTVILLEADGPDFCAGADLDQTIRNATTYGPIENLADASRLGDLFVRMRRLGKVVIAGVHGRALAGGAGLALACDLVLASADAELGFPEVKHGLVPAMVGAILRRSVGEKVGFELLARGGRLSARDALRLGMVNRVLTTERFREEARDYAREMASLSPSALLLIKRLFYGQDNLGFEDAIGRGAEVNVIARSTPDAKQGVARFLGPRA
jgi:methylglutaconyl-CoA hydratase